MEDKQVQNNDTKRWPIKDNQVQCSDNEKNRISKISKLKSVTLDIMILAIIFTHQIYVSGSRLFDQKLSEIRLKKPA